MNFAESITILIAGILALGMINGFVRVAPDFQLVINRVFIGKNERTGLNDLTHERLNGLLLDIGKHSDDHLATSLNHTQDRRLFFFQCASSWRTFQPSSAPRSSLVKHRFGMSFMSCDNVHFVAFHFPAQLDWLFLTTIPSRSWVVMSCTTSLSRSSSAAICWLDKFSPMKYRHNTHTRNG